jgi:small subunit ribosomal protein S9
MVTKKSTPTEVPVKEMHRAVGRRKTAAARVRLTKGSGGIVVNTRDFTQYFPTALLQQIVRSPLVLIGKEKEYDVSVRVVGGGPKGQAEAVRHGIARALTGMDQSVRKDLKQRGFLKRDPRAKERKKFGLKAARRAPQWSKR